VKQSWISAEVINSTTADAVNTVLSMDSDAVASTNIDQLAETRYSQSSTLGYYSGGNTSVTYRSHFTPEVHLGIPSTSSENAVVGGSGPVELFYWIISTQSVAGATGNVAYRVRVVFDVVFTELKSPSP